MVALQLRNRPVSVAGTTDASGRVNLRHRPQVFRVLEYVLIFEDRRTSTLTLRVALVWARIKFKRLRRRFLPRPAHLEGGAPLRFRCVHGRAGTPEFPGQVPDPRSVVGTIVSSIAVESRCPVENANMLRG